MRARSLGTLTLALAVFAAACAGNSTGSTGSAGTSGGTAGTTGVGGTTSTDAGGTAATGAGGATSTGVAGSGPTGVAGTTGTGAGGTSVGGGGHAGTGAGGATTGTAGTTGAGGGATSACQSNATFCSGFEEASGPPVNMPVGTATLEAYTGTFTDLMALDTTVFHSGKQSLKVLSGTAMSAYRMLSVPIPGPTFWVRMYIRSDDTFGDSTAIHNTFFQGVLTPDPNGSGQVQVAEQWCQVLINVNDALFPTGLSSCSATGPTLSPNIWHCVEAFFDGPNGVVQVYGDNGAKIIDAEKWAPATETYGGFQFGFRQVSGPARNMWYDDVVVAPTRVGCP